MNSEKKWLYSQEASRYAGVHPKTLKRWHKKGILSMEVIYTERGKENQYKKEDLDKILEKRRPKEQQTDIVQGKDLVQSLSTPLVEQIKVKDNLYKDLRKLERKNGFKTSTLWAISLLLVLSLVGIYFGYLKGNEIYKNQQNDFRTKLQQQQEKYSENLTTKENQLSILRQKLDSLTEQYAVQLEKVGQEIKKIRKRENK